jgi:hypothetical protein
MTSSNSEVIKQAISKLSVDERRAMFPPIERKNFVVRESWYGRGQIISFVNNKGEKITYNHDVVLDILDEKTGIKKKNAWKKYGYWSQSTNIPMILRFSEVLTKEDQQFLESLVKTKKK